VARRSHCNVWIPETENPPNCPSKKCRSTLWNKGEVDGRTREARIKAGGIASDPEGRLWFILWVDDEKIALRRLDDRVMLSLLRGGERIEISWEQSAAGWELKSP
jgi:hypothetical protein